MLFLPFYFSICKLDWVGPTQFSLFNPRPNETQQKLKKKNLNNAQPESKVAQPFWVCSPSCLNCQVQTPVLKATYHSPSEEKYDILFGVVELTRANAVCDGIMALPSLCGDKLYNNDCHTIIRSNMYSRKSSKIRYLH